MTRIRLTAWGAHTTSNVMAKLKSLDKLLSTTVFVAAEKWMVRSTGVDGFISLKNGNLGR